ncbi:MAG: hypothetical protein ACRDL4_08260 [Thermoleophilaceae bacterium]
MAAPVNIFERPTSPGARSRVEPDSHAELEEDLAPSSTEASGGVPTDARVRPAERHARAPHRLAVAAVLLAGFALAGVLFGGGGQLSA